MSKPTTKTPNRKSSTSAPGAKLPNRINQHYELSPDDQYIFDQIADAVQNIDKSIMALGGAQNTWMPESSISYDRFKTMLLHQAQTYDSSITRPQVNALLRAYSECVKAVIDQNTSVDLNWATVGGETRKPRLITGVLLTRKEAQGEPVFSTAISGKPYCTFPRKLQEGSSFMTAEEYYNQPILKFTTEARLYRKLSHINELPEFAGYSEEQINNITAKADKQYFATLTKSEVAKSRKRIRDLGQNYARTHAQDTPKPLPDFESWDMTNKFSVWCMQEGSRHNAYFATLPHEEKIYFFRETATKALYRKNTSLVLPEHALYYYNLNQPYVPLPEHIQTYEPHETAFFEALYKWGESLSKDPNTPMPQILTEPKPLAIIQRDGD